MNRIMPKIDRPEISWEDWVEGYDKDHPVGPCCHLDCDKESEWLIVHGDSPDDNTVSCTTHIGQLLTDAPMHYISPL
ncbi:MAG: hypothetical protein V3V41_01630 [Candidatus Heimdallarchaeota archaeon]